MELRSGSEYEMRYTQRERASIQSRTHDCTVHRIEFCSTNNGLQIQKPIPKTRICPIKSDRLPSTLNWQVQFSTLAGSTTLTCLINEHARLTFFTFLKTISLFSRSFFQKILSLCTSLLVY